MPGLTRLALLLCIFVAPACHESLGLHGDPGEDAGIDDDSDSITNDDEDKASAVDTDGDTTPDYLDLDSDDDTIRDGLEAGDHRLTTPPVDSDGDRTPDFRDQDSDANRVLDIDEGGGDVDVDGTIDSADPDNDGDGLTDVVELQGHPEAPPDTDGDGTPDYKDIDSDGDFITDFEERLEDTDSDSIYDYLDLDTDSDGIPDAVEAGDENLDTVARDTDRDGKPDFRDADSDADGLSDAWEWEMEDCNPFSGDSDGDGYPDLFEVGSDCGGCTGYPCPRMDYDIVFIMHYNDPSHPPDPPLDPDPTMEHVVRQTDLMTADVFLALDSSATMAGEIESLRTSLSTTVVPSVLAMIPNTWFGVGRFEDCGSCAHDMAMVQEMTDVISDVEAALTGWSTCGGLEPYTQYLYALATGDVVPFAGWGGVSPTSWTCTPPGMIGWPCFRPDALPIVIQIGDEHFDEAVWSCSPGKDHDQAIAALNDIHASYIGINSGTGSTSAHDDMAVIARGTGMVDASGAPLVFDVASSGEGLGTQIVDAIEALAQQVPVELTAVLRDDLSDRVDTVGEFVDHVEPSVAGGYHDPRDPTIVCAGGLMVDDRHAPLDGTPDTFTEVLPGTPVCFDVHVKQNWTVPATSEPQVFGMEVDVVANDVTVVNTAQIYFLVPPEGYPPPPP